MRREIHRLDRAMKSGASAAELDAILADIRVEREIRKRAAELTRVAINHRNLALIGDLMRAAIELTE